MPKLPLRKSKNCLNCSTRVNDRFCPKCGQENIENRPTIRRLFDEVSYFLIYYDSTFLKTLRLLISKPGTLIKEYLSGKRKSYYPPVRLYVVSIFIVFLLPAVLPGIPDNPNESDKNHSGSVSGFDGFRIGEIEYVNTLQLLDSVQTVLPLNEKLSEEEYAKYKKAINEAHLIDSLGLELKNSFGYTVDIDNHNLDIYHYFGYENEFSGVYTVTEFDSVYKSLPVDKKPSKFEKLVMRKSIEWDERGLLKNKDYLDRLFYIAFFGNLPKAIFIYMPIFALTLWVFQDKKKWKYYDHAIFTFYFFSLLLFLISFIVLFYILTFQLLRINSSWRFILNIVGGIFAATTLLYSILNFFRAHQKVYGENRLTSRVKSSFLFLINSFLILLGAFAYTIYAFVSL